MLASVSAYARSPIDNVENGVQDITLRWDYISVTGGEQVGAQLQWSTDGTTWTDLPAVTGSDTFLTVDAGTFTGGDVYWRVRVAVSAGDYGAWSETVSFVCVYPPTIAGVIADGKPFLTIEWQSAGQVGYQIKIEDLTSFVAPWKEKTLGPYYGPDVRSHTLTMPLISEHSYRIRVRVQNRFSLWSEWETADVYIAWYTMYPRNFQVLCQSKPNEVWIDAGSSSLPDKFWVYRDDILIGKSGYPKTAYIDRMTASPHEYSALAYYDGIDVCKYLIGTAGPVAPTQSAPAIAEINSGDWVELRLSENRDRVLTMSKAQATAYLHLSSGTYPTAEIGREKSFTGSFDVSFPYGEKGEADAAAFEALIGKACVLKTLKGRVIVGILSALKIRDSRFYRSYTFEMQQMEWGDYVDES